MTITLATTTALLSLLVIRLLYVLTHYADADFKALLYRDGWRVTTLAPDDLGVWNQWGRNGYLLTVRKQPGKYRVLVELTNPAGEVIASATHHKPEPPFWAVIYSPAYGVAVGRLEVQP